MLILPKAYYHWILCPLCLTPPLCTASKLKFTTFVKKKGQNSSILYYFLLVIQHLSVLLNYGREKPQRKRQSLLVLFHLNFYQHTLNSYAWAKEMIHIPQPNCTHTVTKGAQETSAISWILWALQIWNMACQPTLQVSLDKWHWPGPGVAEEHKQLPGTGLLCSLCYHHICVFHQKEHWKHWLFQV